MKRNPEDTSPKKGPMTEANTTNFGPPVVAAAVKDPAAIRYANELAARRPPKYAVPVAGGATPPIPRLDLSADAGLTMSDQAGMQRAQVSGPPQAPQPTPQRGAMFQPAEQVRPPQAPVAQPGRPPSGILPSDILPAEVRQDPDFRDGQGSMYASAQPNLAHKYGVIRNGERIAPQALTQASRGLRPETLADLKTLGELSSKGAPTESVDARIEREAAAGSAGSAGRLGNAPADGPQADAAATQKNITEAVKKLDDFDFNTFREMMMKDIINNNDQKEIIEKRCKELDISDLIMQGYVTQRVPVIPTKFEPEFQSMTGSEDLAIKRLVMQESKGIEVSERYLLDKFSLMAVTVGLHAINGNPMPSHKNQQGDFDEELFWKKFNFVTRYPFHMLASLGVNYFWFDIRVRKLFVAEKMGNG